MPTKKRRVGFIPRSDVLDLISKLSYESNLSYSKIINILVEEALYKRGLFDITTKKVCNEDERIPEKIYQEKFKNVKKEFIYGYNNNLIKDDNKSVSEVSLDKEIYAKFLIFLQFQERMKKEGL